MQPRRKEGTGEGVPVQASPCFLSSTEETPFENQPLRSQERDETSLFPAKDPAVAKETRVHQAAWSLVSSSCLNKCWDVATNQGWGGSDDGAL